MALTLVIIAVLWAIYDVIAYTGGGWKRYALTDREWARLQHHYQQLEHKNREVY